MSRKWANQEEMKATVMESLRNNGVVNNLQAKFLKNSAEVLQSSSITEVTSSPKIRNTKSYDIATDIVIEFLSSHNFTNSQECLVIEGVKQKTIDSKKLLDLKGKSPIIYELLKEWNQTKEKVITNNFSKLRQRIKAQLDSIEVSSDDEDNQSSSKNLPPPIQRASTSSNQPKPVLKPENQEEEDEYYDEEEETHEKMVLPKPNEFIPEKDESEYYSDEEPATPVKNQSHVIATQEADSLIHDVDDDEYSYEEEEKEKEITKPVPESPAKQESSEYYSEPEDGFVPVKDEDSEYSEQVPKKKLNSNLPIIRK